MKFKKLVLFLLIVVFSTLRFVSLEGDTPAYNIAGISQTDEPYYCLMGINKYLIESNRLVKELNKVKFQFLGIHNYHITYWSLKYLGNSYIGLRTPVVLISILSILLLLKVFFVRNKQFIFRVFMIVFLFSEFSFAVMSRFQNPQIYAIFWMIVSLVLIHEFDISNKRFYRILGLSVAILNVILIYPYALFFALGAAFWLINSAIKDWTIKPILDGLYSLIFSLVIFISVLFLLDLTILDVIKDFEQFNSVRDESTTVSFLIAFKSMLTQIPLTNLFRFNLLLLLPMILMFYFGVKEYKIFHKSNLNSFAFFAFCSAFLQSAFISSYPFKKWILLFPIVVVALFYLIEKMREKDFLNWKIIFIIFFSSLVSLYNWKVTNSDLYWSGMTSYKYTAAPLWLNYSILIVPLMVFVMFLLYGKKAYFRKLFLISVSFLCIIPTSYFLIYSSTTILKDLLIGNREVINDRIILGNFSHAFSLYNEGIVLLNHYDITVRGLTKKEIQDVLMNQDPLSTIWIDKNIPNGLGLPNKYLKYGRKLYYVKTYENQSFKYSLYAEKSKNRDK